jgi:penicillin amidase
VLGSAALPQDRFLRTVGFGRAAKSAWDRLPADSRALVDAYVAGINAFISTHHGSRLPPEFTLLRFEPEPWTGADVLAWVKMMAWDLSGNYSLELLRHDIAARVGADGMRELMPPPSSSALSILGADLVAPYVHTNPRSTRSSANLTAPSASASAIQAALPALSRLFTPDAAEGAGSNNWVVDGTMTASGQPLLANDPHLAAKVPSLWYLAHMHFGDEDLIGATPGHAPSRSGVTARSPGARPTWRRMSKTCTSNISIPPDASQTFRAGRSRSAASRKRFTSTAASPSP